MVLRDDYDHFHLLGKRFWRSSSSDMDRFGQPEVFDLIFVFDEENDAVKTLNERDGFHPEAIYQRMFDLGLRRTVCAPHAFASAISGAFVPPEE